MNFYENLVILDPALNDKTLEEATERIKDLIVKKGGEILKSENWGRKKLAYELKKRTEGFYLLVLFKAPSSAIIELERFYKIYEPVFKFLVIKLKKKQIESALPAITETGGSKGPEPVPAKKPESTRAEEEKGVQ